MNDRMIVVWDGPTQIVRPALPGEIPDAPPPTIADYRAAIDAHVEATAKARDYNSAAHMASYVASTVPAWADEAKAFVAWRDAVWVTAFNLLRTLTEPIPVADAIDMLPKVEWPE